MGGRLIVRKIKPLKIKKVSKIAKQRYRQAEKYYAKAHQALKAQGLTVYMSSIKYALAGKTSKKGRFGVITSQGNVKNKAIYVRLQKRYKILISSPKRLAGLEEKAKLIKQIKKLEQRSMEESRTSTEFYYLNTELVTAFNRSTERYRTQLEQEYDLYNKKRNNKTVKRVVIEA